MSEYIWGWWYSCMTRLLMLHRMMYLEIMTSTDASRERKEFPPPNVLLAHPDPVCYVWRNCFKTAHCCKGALLIHNEEDIYAMLEPS